MKPENIKCGEIIRYAPGKYTFNCSHCSESFIRKSAALCHFESHFTVESTSTMKLEVDYNVQVQEEPQDVADHKDELQSQSYVADIKQEDPLEICSENIFLSDQTLNDEYFNIEQISVETTLESTLPSKSNDHVDVERCLSPKSNFKWGPTFTSRTLMDCDICSKKVVKFHLKGHFLAHLNRREFVCTICNKAFNNINQLKKHSLSHLTIKKYSCDYCGWQFNDRYNLTVHMRKHTGEKPYKCKICDKSFSTSSTLKTHTRTHTGDKPYKCNLCDRSFAQSGGFRMHVHRHQCNLCENKRFVASSAFKRHLKSMHNLKSHSNKILLECDICGKQMERSNLKKHFLVHLNQKGFVCSICKRGFNTKYQLRAHSSTHSTTKRFCCDQCGWRFHDRGNLIVHIRKHTGEKPYKCKICDKSFSQSTTLKGHNRTHTGDKPYKCKLCDQSFSQKTSLRMHVNRHNNYHESHQCKLCEIKPFATLLNLQSHMKSMHNTKPKPQRSESLFECDTCGKKLTRLNIKKHLLSHVNQRECICTVCNRSFKYKYQLRRHSSIHSTKRFNCDHCGWQFHSHANLVVHTRKHTGEKPYKCKICEKSFSQSSTLKTHIRMHTGDKPYKCITCDKSFASSSALKTHKNTSTHTSEKKYKCRVCDAYYFQRTSRRKHEKSIHKEVAHLLINT